MLKQKIGDSLIFFFVKLFDNKLFENYFLIKYRSIFEKEKALDFQKNVTFLDLIMSSITSFIYTSKKINQLTDLKNALDSKKKSCKFFQKIPS